jgi:hypothetical protein
MRFSFRTLLSALAIAGVVLFYQNFIKEVPKSWRHPLVAPRENADGTVDHVLISKALEHSAGHYFILRFSQDHKLRLSDGFDTSTVSLEGVPTITLKGVPNYYVVALYDMDDGLKPISKKATDIKTTRQLRLNYTFFTEKSFKETLDLQMKEANEACAPPIKFPTGVVEYRLKDGRDPRARPSCFGHLEPEGRKTRAYLLIDPSQTSTSQYQCTWPSQNGTWTGLCSGQIVVTGKIGALATFYFEEDITPDDLQKITTTVITRMNEAFVQYGELKPEDTFSFSNTGDNK